ncbi:MAG TPA: type II toxin-antitoxin system RelE/ParE family toxin [Pyrinomonadaceae bacterium]|nr:type II toxin-antitoxin system RelE/ParE family toxin [Pyrinomonadaceae bacterium]
MKRVFSTHPEALQDLDESLQFYLSKDVVIAADFVDAYDLNIELIKSYPESYPTVRATYRRKIMNRFPFSIVYTCSKTEIRILAVAHHSRDPEFWINRS